VSRRAVRARHAPSVYSQVVLLAQRDLVADQDRHVHWSGANAAVGAHSTLGGLMTHVAVPVSQGGSASADMPHHPLSDGTGSLTKLSAPMAE
jgi:hypothetical protein